MNYVDKLYKIALKDLLTKGTEENDKRLFHKDQPRSESKTKALPGYTIQLDLEKDGFPLISLRKLPIKIFIAETLWFLQGDNTTDKFLSDYTKIWDWFEEEDETVTSYGHRWRRYFGRDQLKGVLETLEKDPTSRHGVMMTWDPGSDSLTNGTKRKNVPCNLGMVLNIIDGRLNINSIWRSVDMILGFPTDIAGNALLCQILAAKLGVRPGIYTHFISNAHIYDIHYDIAQELIERESEQKKINLDAKTGWFERAEKYDHGLTKDIIAQVEEQYTPQEAIKGIKIVI